MSYSDFIDNQAHPFESEVFQQCWLTYLAKHFKAVQQYRDLVICIKSGKLPFFHLRKMEFIGNSAPFGNTIDAQQFNDLLCFMKQSRWDVFQMKGYQSPLRGYSTEWIMQAFLAEGFQPEIWADTPEYYADLSDGWDAYLASQSKTRKRTIKRKLKKAEPLNPEFKVYTSVDEVESFLEQFFTYHIAHWRNQGAGSYFEKECEKKFMLAFVKKCCLQGSAQMTKLFLDGEVVNFSVIFLYQRTAYVHLTVNTGQYADYAPGALTLYYQMQHVISEGFSTFHLGYGENALKTSVAPYRQERYILRACNPKSLIGKVYMLFQNQKTKRKM